MARFCRHCPQAGAAPAVAGPGIHPTSQFHTPAGGARTAQGLERKSAAEVRERLRRLTDCKPSLSRAPPLPLLVPDKPCLACCPSPLPAHRRWGPRAWQQPPLCTLPLPPIPACLRTSRHQVAGRELDRVGAQTAHWLGWAADPRTVAACPSLSSCRRALCRGRARGRGGQQDKGEGQGGAGEGGTGWLKVGAVGLEVAGPAGRAQGPTHLPTRKLPPAGLARIQGDHPRDQGEAALGDAGASASGQRLQAASVWRQAARGAPGAPRQRCRAPQDMLPSAPVTVPTQPPA